VRGRPVTDVERERVRELHAAGLSRNAVAAELGRPWATISAVAKSLGLSWDREAPRVAIEARVVDAKARRAALLVALLDDAERLRRQIWEPHTYREHGGKDFVEAKWTQPEPTSADKLKLMQAAGIAVDKSMRLDQHDSDTQGLAAVDAWLRDMMGGE
jgi:hypothetical protein